MSGATRVGSTQAPVRIPGPSLEHSVVLFRSCSAVQKSECWSDPHRCPLHVLDVSHSAACAWCLPTKGAWVHTCEGGRSLLSPQPHAAIASFEALHAVDTYLSTSQPNDHRKQAQWRKVKQDPVSSWLLSCPFPKPLCATVSEYIETLHLIAHGDCLLSHLGVKLWWI